MLSSEQARELLDLLPRRGMYPREKLKLEKDDIRVLMDELLCLLVEKGNDDGAMALVQKHRDHQEPEEYATHAALGAFQTARRVLAKLNITEDVPSSLGLWTYKYSITHLEKPPTYGTHFQYWGYLLYLALHCIA